MLLHTVVERTERSSQTRLSHHGMEAVKQALINDLESYPAWMA
jgi:hypothetical protein